MTYTLSFLEYGGCLNATDSSDISLNATYRNENQCSAESLFVLTRCCLGVFSVRGGGAFLLFGFGMGEGHWH